MAFRIPYNSRTGRPSVKPSAEELAELYKKYKYVEIAKMYGVKPDTVKHWVYVYRKEDKEAMKREAEEAKSALENEN